MQVNNLQIFENIHAVICFSAKSNHQTHALLFRASIFVFLLLLNLHACLVRLHNSSYRPATSVPQNSSL